MSSLKELCQTTYWPPDSDREIELKRQLAEIQERYLRDIQPIREELLKIQAMKVPKIVIYPVQVQAKTDD